MKRIAEWWGIQFIPESDKDQELLKELHDSISNRDSDYYEDGTIILEKENKEINKLTFER